MVLEGKGHGIGVHDGGPHAARFVMPTPLPKSAQELLVWLVLGPKVA
jgi:hypothetical protein